VYGAACVLCFGFSVAVAPSRGSGCGCGCPGSELCFGAMSVNLFKAIKSPFARPESFFRHVFIIVNCLALISGAVVVGEHKAERSVFQVCYISPEGSHEDAATHPNTVTWSDIEEGSPRPHHHPSMCIHAARARSSWVLVAGRGVDHGTRGWCSCPNLIFLSAGTAMCAPNPRPPATQPSACGSCPPLHSTSFPGYPDRVLHPAAAELAGVCRGGRLRLLPPPPLPARDIPTQEAGPDSRAQLPAGVHRVLAGDCCPVRPIATIAHSPLSFTHGPLPRAHGRRPLPSCRCPPLCPLPAAKLPPTPVSAIHNPLPVTRYLMSCAQYPSARPTLCPRHVPPRVCNPTLINMLPHQ
jgi:hypothetical protein